MLVSELSWDLVKDGANLRIGPQPNWRRLPPNWLGCLQSKGRLRPRSKLPCIQNPRNHDAPPREQSPPVPRTECSWHRDSHADELPQSVRFKPRYGDRLLWTGRLANAAAEASLSTDNGDPLRALPVWIGCDVNDPLRAGPCAKRAPVATFRIDDSPLRQ